MKYYTFFIFGFIGCFFDTKAYSQMVSIIGKVRGAEDVENIHVINKTSKTYTITDKDGQFAIPVKLNDTLQFSSIQYNVLEAIIDNSVISNKAIRVDLKELINALDEVVVGKVLTGNLMLDIRGFSDGQMNNFHNVSATVLNDRRIMKGKQGYNLSKEFNSRIGGGGVGVSLPVSSVVNVLSGKTKKLKEYIKMEHNDKLISEIRDQISVVFFTEHPLDEDYRMDFWYFCSEDPNFQMHCKAQIDTETIVFLNNKYNEYQKNLKSISN